MNVEIIYTFLIDDDVCKEISEAKAPKLENVKLGITNETQMEHRLELAAYLIS